MPPNDTDSTILKYFESIEETLEKSSGSFEEWCRVDISIRARYIKRLRHAVVSRQEEIACTIAEETGKPVTEIMSQEITAVLEMARFFESSYPSLLRGRTFRYWTPGFWTKVNTVRFEPIGVLLVIGPSNFPFSLVLAQAAAALLCGNCVIVKPSERCPKTAQLISRAFHDADFPPGVAEVIEGPPVVAEKLISNDVVRKVIFTGSYEAGRKVAEMCGRAFKPCILELGGDGAAIVCEDAYLTLAAKGISWSALYANSRSCVGTRRVYVHELILEEFVIKFMRELRKTVTGDPLNPATGRVSRISETEIEQIGKYIEAAREKGAKILTQSDVPHQAYEDRNNPLVLLFPLESGIASSGCAEAGTSDETPPHVIRIFPFTENRQVADAVNSSKFGLSASIWSGNSAAARKLAARIDAGMIWINDSSAGLPQFPWGGRKRSGWGRLYAPEALSELCSLKVVSHDRRISSRSKFWWFPYSREKYELLSRVNETVYGKASLSKALRLVVAATRYFFRS